ncbi:MAG TPA: hypothetical protein PLX84_09105 [Acidiphilium sp.]|nr:hypothetical protein [Acidiphilium sp.]
MRYYDLTLTNPQTGAVVKHWTSHPNGQFDPGALNVMFDIITSVGSIAVGAQSIIVEGISLADLGNAEQFGTVSLPKNKFTPGCNISLKGGMKAGLPLANPAQAGPLTIGAVQQSFGNWVGTDMSLALVVVPTIYTHHTPGNFVLNWQKDEPLAAALQLTLQTVYPKAKITIKISPALVATRSDISFHGTFSQLARHVKSITEGTISATYLGVEMAPVAGGFTVFDGTTTPATGSPQPVKTLTFTDFIGQPTWIRPSHIQVKTVMRGDIHVGDLVKFPAGFENAPGFVQTTQASQPGYSRYKSIIQGQFFVAQVRHVGNFRDPDGGAWASIFNLVPN